MQKKVIKAFALGIILFFTCVEFSEIINFIYITPFSTPFFLFLASAETELYKERLGYSIPFIFGLISDILVLHGIFVLCVVFPLLSFIIYYLVNDLKISKVHIFFLTNLVFAFILYSAGIPLWSSLIIAGSGFLAWKVFNLLCTRILAKDNG